MHHLLSASLFHQDMEERHPMGHVTGHNSFLRGGGSFCLWRWLITADSFVSHIVTLFHLCILLSERPCPPLSLTMAMHQCYNKASKLEFCQWSCQYFFWPILFFGRAYKSFTTQTLKTCKPVGFLWSWPGNNIDVVVFLFRIEHNYWR